ncbi:hypothetical protein [Sphingomonas sp. M1A8_2b]
MATWQRSWRTDLGLRAAGVFLFGLAYLGIARLASLHVALHIRAHGGAGLGYELRAYGWAMVGFLGASGGSILTLLGARIFDQITVSARWRVNRMPNDQMNRSSTSDDQRRQDRGSRWD